jgi:hypothetical protein
MSSRDRAGISVSGENRATMSQIVAADVIFSESINEYCARRSNASSFRAPRSRNTSPER